MAMIARSGPWQTQAKILTLTWLLFGPITTSTLPAQGFDSGTRIDREWPRWRGPDGDGRWNPAGLPDDFASRTPVEQWSVRVGGGFSGVTVFEGRVYVMDRPKEPADRERVLCFDAGSGRMLWEHSWPAAYGKLEYGTGPRASVTLCRDASGSARAFALGAVGTAACLDAVSGDVIWQRDLRQEVGAKVPTWGFAASPLLWRSTVVLHVAAQPGGSLLALDQATGKEVWRSGTDAAGYCTPEIIDLPSGRQLIAWGPEHIQSFEPDSGKPLWTYPYKITYGVSIAQPLFQDGHLIVSGYWHGTKALDLRDSPTHPKLAWENEKDICGLMSAPLFKNGNVYMLDKNKGLQCFDLKTGRIFWDDGNQLTPAGRNPQLNMVWLDESRGLISLLNANGEFIHARLTSTGADELARHQIIGKTWAHPGFTRNHVFARSDTELKAFKLWE